jgi:hypothetical protein
VKCNDKEWQDCSVEKMGCTGCYYNEIEIGEYVRSETGRIDQVTDNEYYLPQYIECKKGIIRRVNIVDHSENIKDLIKERDILRYKLKGLDSEYITIVKKYHDARSNQDWLMINGYKLEQVEILGIIACEKYEKEEYKV